MIPAVLCTGSVTVMGCVLHHGGHVNCLGQVDNILLLYIFKKL